MIKVFAQSLTLPSEPGQTPVVIEGPVKWATDIGAIITKAIPFIFAFAGIGLLIILIAGGFGVLTSSGDAKKLAGASQRITYAIVGFIVIFTAFWAVQLAGKILGIPEIQSTFK
ncbi:hypothetical protein HYV22_03785 [Candidatus Gottesmanbacteria bacterium]|nr:hypothetical protein [Candidatus Gottesmanbacteria bacterium]